MASAVPFITAASTALQVFGAIQQGQAAKSAADYNADIATQNAQISREEAARQAAQEDRLKRQRIGAIKAAGGASGVTPASSVFDVLGDTAAQEELQKQDILYQGELRARGYSNTAALDTMKGKNAVTSSYLQAGQDLLGGGVKTYQQYKRLA